MEEAVRPNENRQLRYAAAGEILLCADPQRTHNRRFQAGIPERRDVVFGVIATKLVGSKDQPWIGWLVHAEKPAVVTSAAQWQKKQRSAQDCRTRRAHPIKIYLCQQTGLLRSSVAPLREDPVQSTRRRLSTLRRAAIGIHYVAKLMPLGSVRFADHYVGFLQQFTVR